MAGKSISFVVNDYDTSANADSSTLAAPLSYFILGANKADSADPVKALRGDELVEGLVFKDDLRDSVAPTKAYHREDGTGDVYVASDTVRTDLTDELLTRGGWREHTDGNRISTTRGDSVEVVYGNYKLVVLGRVTDAFDPTQRGGLGAANGANSTLESTFFDASGGHITEGTSAEGKVVSCIWKDDEVDGSWQTLEQTDHGDKKTVYRGYYEREHYGEKIRREIGRGVDSIAIDAGANTAAAHEAEKPDITSHTFARSISETTFVDDSSNDTTVSGTFERRVDVGERYVDAKDHSTISMGVFAAGFREELMAQTIETKRDYTAWRFTVEGGVVGAHVFMLPYHETLYSGSHMRVWALGTSFELLAGLSTSVNIGMDNVYRTGPSIDHNVGAQVVLRSSVDVVLGMYRGSLWMKRHKMGLLVGAVAATATAVSAATLIG